MGSSVTKTTKYTVMAVGNALVDHEYAVTDAQLSDTQLTKGNMTLVEHDEQIQLVKQLTELDVAPSKLAGGGSAANSMYAIASLGGKSFYACRVGDDKAGDFYLQDLQAAGVYTSDVSVVEGGVTGSCMVCVTPDAERTMQTYLGTSSDIQEANIDFDALVSSDWLYLEGYLAMSPSMQTAITKLRQQAGVNQVKIAVSFADPAVVKFAKPGLQHMLGNGVEVVFCNMEEAKLFTGKKHKKSAVRALLEFCKVAVVTNGAEGAWIGHKGDYPIQKQTQDKNNDGKQTTQEDQQNQQENDQDSPSSDKTDVQIVNVATPTVVNVLDTNGAGDNYAGAFLYGLTQGYDLIHSAELASEVASQVIQQFGPRLQANVYQDIAKQVLNV